MLRERNIQGRETAAREGGRGADRSRARATARTTRLNMGKTYHGGGRGGWLGLLAQPSALFCVSLMAFLVVAGMRLWEDGWFNPIFGPKGAGPIESGPIRFDPRTRGHAKPYTAAPAPSAPAPADNASSDDR